MRLAWARMSRMGNGIPREQSFVVQQKHRGENNIDKDVETMDLTPEEWIGASLERIQWRRSV